MSREIPIFFSSCRGMVYCKCLIEHKNAMTQVNIYAQLEALLFAAGEPVELDRLADTLALSREELETAVAQLQTSYQQSADRGLAVILHQGMIELVTRPEYSELVSVWMQASKKEALSKAALEVLAIVAYREPITRSAIEAIRGVNCQMTLRTLLLRGLVDRQEEDAIRGYTYTLSFDCLKYLGLSRKEDLPEYEELSQDERLTALERTMDEG